MKVYVGVIEIDGGGTNIYVGRTREGAFSKIYGYVDEWWVKEFGCDVRMPKDPDEAVRQYFDEMMPKEFYYIQEFTLED